MKNILKSLSLLSLVVHQAAAGGYAVLSLEPYLAEWCAAQWPDQITEFTGFDQAHLLRFRDYVRIEPYAAYYCFDQFPEALAEQKREETITKMANFHTQIEPYLMEWGEASIKDPALAHRIELEPYMAEWCVEGQFRRLFSNKNVALGQAARNSVHPETAFGRWCFAQFANELSGLDEDDEIERLKQSHEKVEQHLMKWEAAVYGSETSNKYQEQSGMAIGVGAGIGIALAVLLPIWGLCWWRRRRLLNKEKEFQTEVSTVENGVDIAS